MSIEAISSLQIKKREISREIKYTELNNSEDLIY